VTARLRALVSDSWTIVAALSALTTLMVLFVHVPASVWSGNVAEFHFRFTTFLTVGLAAVAAGLVVMLIGFVVLPRRARPAAASLVGALGIVCWVYGELLVAPLTALNGQQPPLDAAVADAWRGWEPPLVLVACALIAIGIRKLRGPTTLALVTLNVALSLTTAQAVFAVRSRPSKAPQTTNDASIFRFSPTRNVLVILLDGLQADVADEVMRSTPAVRDAFDGFRSYGDTVGIGTTTFLSLPAIHSGALYRPQDRLPAYFEDAIAHHSFMTRFADAGYRAEMVNPIEGICPDRVAVCTSTDRLLRSPGSQLRLESLYLLDLSLLRVSPIALKRRVYDDGRWLFSDRAVEPGAGSGGSPQSFDEAGILDGVRFFSEMSRQFSANEATPTIKFIHSFATHTPYVLNDNCSIGGSALAHVSSQARCTLKAVSELLQRMKQAGVYDNTVILVLADHGINPGVYGQDKPGSPGNDVAWTHLEGAAHPLFLLKGRGSRGPLQAAPGAVHLIDVTATLCTASGACTAPAGRPAGPGDDNRPRPFVDYVWKHEYWQTRDIPGMTRYVVRGPVWRRESWSAERPGNR
jgi:hypothetical protein